MTKEMLVSAIASRLGSMGLTVQAGAGTDLSIHQEFLDAGWSTGEKKITYEALILVDAAGQTVRMYEKTTETGAGFSFGSEAESSFQSGKTLMRRVRSVQYGPDGKAYDVDLDLGAIPKAVKATAAEQGWDFKTVIRRQKAMYEPGAAGPPVPAAPVAAAPAAPPAGPPTGWAGTAPPQPAPPPPVQPVSAPPGAPAGGWATPPAAPPARPGGKGPLIGVIALGLVAVLLLLVLKSGPVGWGVAAAVLAGMFFALRAMPAGGKGMVLSAVLWLAAAFVIFVAAAVTAPSAPSGQQAGPTPSASASTPTAPTSAPATPAPTAGFQFVSGGLTSDADLTFDDAAGFGATVVAVGHVDPKYGESDEADVDLALAYSSDGGANWAWGGKLQLPGEQWPEAVLVQPEGAIVVGWQRTKEGDSFGNSQAFIAAARAPDFVPQEIKPPAEFNGRAVDLYDIADVDGTWVIVGMAMDAKGINGCIWRSSDDGDTWSRQVIPMGKRWFSPTQLLVGADGTWNLVGTAGLPGKAANVAWLRSSDAGRTFRQMQPDSFAAKTDESAKQLVLSDNGLAALLGNTKDADGNHMHVLWASNSQGVMQRLTEEYLPDQGGSKLSLGGVMFLDETLIAYGPPGGRSWSDTVQFWSFTDDGKWVPGARITQGATSFVGQVLTGGEVALALGMNTPAGGADTIGVWRGSLR